MRVSYEILVHKSFVKPSLKIRTPKSFKNCYWIWVQVLGVALYLELHRR